MITNWKVGDEVMISPESFKHIENSSKSILRYPDDSYLRTARACIGIGGVVERKFLPGYEVNVRFGNGAILQVKDHWIVPAY